MSRTNISVLLATALLGVLLWVVLSIVRDVARAPEVPLPRPEAIEADKSTSSLPVISDRRDLDRWLTAEGYAAAAYIEDYRRWLASRGFPTRSPALITDGTQSIDMPYAEHDDATLLLLIGQGDINATHELAERSIATDPLAALEWFDQAIVNGSVYAMLRVADLLATLTSPELTEFVSDPVWQAALETVNDKSPDARESALAWAIAAVTVGGYAVVDPGHADRLKALSEPFDDSGLERACRTAQELVLETAAARRAQGGAVFSTDAPAMALSARQPDKSIPCAIPVMPLVSLDTCEQRNFLGPGSRIMTAWLCPEH